MLRKTHLETLLLCILPFLAQPSVLVAGPRGPRSDQEIGVLANKEIAAVQRPLFPTRKTVELGVVAGLFPTDPYVLGSSIGMAAGYHFSETLSAELLLEYASGSDTAQSLILQDLGVRVDAYSPRLVSSVNGSWTPIYAKLNLLGYRVIHYDISLTGGLGLFLAERMIYNDTEGGEIGARYNIPVSVNAGLNQRFYARFAGYTFALRLDVRDYLYLQDSVSGSKWLKHNWMVGTGVSWFFGAGGASHGSSNAGEKSGNSGGGHE